MTDEKLTTAEAAKKKGLLIGLLTGSHSNPATPEPIAIGVANGSTIYAITLTREEARDVGRELIELANRGAS